jgi:nitrile hydratase accessory protein
MKGERERILPVDGPDAPPRANGELVFAAPWESRAFGMAVSLHEHGLFEWEEFRALLIEEIGAWDRAHPDGSGYSYYARWLAALETLLARRGLCAAAEVEARGRHLSARAPGHDHL